MKPIYIHLGPARENLPVGASHWFGYPDLPPDFDIPTVEEEDGSFAMTLVCQINLSQLPPCGLPEAGLLLFFADIAYYSGDWDEPKIFMHPCGPDVCRVVYVPADRMGELQSCRKFYAEQDEAKAIPLIFNHKKPTLEEPDLQLLGTTDRLEWETWPEPCEGWQLLLMMDSMEGDDYNYNFVDCGALCFIIDPEDLKKRDFSNVHAIILST